jgi:DNA invertase Pin-like site-specific DNA recombinase
MSPLRAAIWCAVSTHAQHEPEKVSLPEQEEQSRLHAQKNGWQVVDLMKVPGHSRRYIDFHELAADAAEEGIDSFYRLKAHWETRDFDVLIIRDGDRFARTQALHAYITEQIIKSGATIFSLADGLIDERNYRMWIAMSGFKAAGEIDRLVKARDTAMTDLAKRGLPITSRIPISHRTLRDEKTGKVTRFEVNENRRRMWDDLAHLILEGIAWERMERELYSRFGHVNDKGEIFHPNFMHRLVMRPMFWGHMARFHCSKESKNGFKTGRWVYDESEPIPEGTLVFRNTHSAVWTGELADRVRQELDRRSQHIRGRAKPHTTHVLSGLVICGECGSFMSVFADRGSKYRGIFCPASKGKATIRHSCSNRGVTNQRPILERLNRYLEQMLCENTTDIFTDQVSDVPTLQRRVARLDADIVRIEDQVRIAIRKQTTAREEVQHIFDEEIEKLSDQLKVMRESRARLQGEALATQHKNAVQQVTLEELASLTLERFWQQESRTINQTLHRLMGKRRLVLLGGEIQGAVEVKRRQVRHA